MASWWRRELGGGHKWTSLEQYKEPTTDCCKYYSKLQIVTNFEKRYQKKKKIKNKPRQGENPC